MKLSEAWQQIPTPFKGYAESHYCRDNHGIAHYLHRHGNRGWYLCHGSGPAIHVAGRFDSIQTAMTKFFAHSTTKTIA